MIVDLATNIRKAHVEVVVFAAASLRTEVLQEMDKLAKLGRLTVVRHDPSLRASFLTAAAEVRLGVERERERERES